jgi:hypothetical protein
MNVSKNFTVDTNTLVVDSSNNRVGIGITNPTYALDVSGNLRTTMDASINSITVGRGGGNVSSNTAFGYQSLLKNIYNSDPDLTLTGLNNTAFGYESLLNNGIGQSNTAIGCQSLKSNINGNYNIAVGSGALLNTKANGNIGIGINTLYYNDTGANNIAIGTESGTNYDAPAPQGLSSSTQCTFIGAYSGSDAVGNYSKSTAIGCNSQITDSNQIVLGTVNEKVFIPKNLQIGVNYNSSSSNTLDVSGNISTKDGTNGYLELINGTTTNTGYVRFYNNLGARCGYIGFGSNTDKKLTLALYNETGDAGYTGWQCIGNFSVVGDLNFTKSNGNVVISNNTSTELGINNFVSNGSYLFRANTSSATPQNIMRLSSGTNEGLVEVTGNIQLTSRAGGSAAIIRNSSSGILTIENNATSSSTQIINKDTGGVTRTNMSLTTAKQIIGGDGTDFQLILTGNATTTTNKTMRIFSTAENQYIDCGTEYAKGTAPLLFRTGAGVERMRMNDFGLVMNATCFYGRNDGHNFTGLPTGALTQPIGFVVEYNEPAGTFGSGTSFSYTSLPLLNNGVWQVNGTLNLTKGNATYDTNSFIRVNFTTATGVSFYPSVNNGSRIEISSTSIVDQINVLLTSTLIINNGNNGTSVRPTIQGQIKVAAVGSATKALNVVFVKIA